MAQIGTLDFKGFIAGRKGQRAGGSEGSGHAYAYASDHSTRQAFERMKPVELAVRAAVRMFKATEKNKLLGNAVKVGPTQFPRVHNLVRQCANELAIAMPSVYIASNPHLNAGTYGTNDDSFIVVHSALVDQFTDEELLGVIGHECGHIHNNHVVYLTAMHCLRFMASVFVQWIVAPAMFALNAWSRRAEITCDRAGLLCTKNLDVSTRSLTKLALGSPKLFAELNMEAFLAQYEEGNADPGRYAELHATHPWLPKRVLALRAFAESELYRKHAGLGAGGLSMADVDKKVHEIIKIWG
ncbi:MAG: M48 family metallopeptidase [Polyangiaceae bacterium]|nr:M48 family metallopeptidase [Polyangiaceae bacterium]